MMQNTLIIDSNNEGAIRYFKEFPYDDPIASQAHWAKVTEYNNKPTLVLYVHFGSKFSDNDIAVYLQWQDGKFNPVKVEVVRTYQNLTLE